jgi:dTDP-4-amino-4,6-dideoxygalactose transaminase
MYYLIMPSLEERQALIAFLKLRGILSVFHYVPLHLSSMGLKLCARTADCPVTEEKSNRLVRLPFFNGLTRGEQDQVIAAVLDFAGSRRKVFPVATTHSSS